MRKLAFTVLGLVSILLNSVFAQEPVIWYQYSQSPPLKVIGVHGVVSITPMDSSCSPDFQFGVIESIDYKSGFALPIGFNLRRTDGFVTYIGLDDRLIDRLGSVDRDYLAKFIRVKKEIAVIAMNCGVAGRVTFAKDIFDAKFIKGRAAVKAN
jgi:hypothetical protein